MAVNDEGHRGRVTVMVVVVGRLMGAAAAVVPWKTEGKQRREEGTKERRAPKKRGRGTEAGKKGAKEGTKEERQGRKEGNDRNLRRGSVKEGRKSTLSAAEVKHVRHFTKCPTQNFADSILCSHSCSKMFPSPLRL